VWGLVNFHSTANQQCSFANTHLDCFSQNPELKTFEYPMNWWLVSMAGSIEWRKPIQVFVGPSGSECRMANLVRTIFLYRIFKLPSKKLQA
jgi:hypothetical protein